jgi:hypothetical protein
MRRALRSASKRDVSCASMFGLEDMIAELLAENERSWNIGPQTWD